MNEFQFTVDIKHTPPLDPTFKPFAIYNKRFREKVADEKNSVLLKIGIERNNGLLSVYETRIFNELSPHKKDNFLYVERLVKTLLWTIGGWKIIIGGPAYIADYIKEQYQKNGKRNFDVHFMTRIYEKEFTVISCKVEKVPVEKEQTKEIGKNLEGCRIGFDAGGSDRKVSAVINGKVVYSEEVIWHPKLQEDPSYQYEGIMDSLRTAASKMPKVDAIGVSAAGVYIDNKIMAASLFIKVPEDIFDKKVKHMFFDIQKEMGNVPIEVANDGDVTALAGALSLETNQVLGIAMGTSEAVGYVDDQGNITGWLNELAFVPIDYNIKAMEDEWSKDIGCGVKYFSQDGVIKLAKAAGVEFEPNLAPAEKLKVIQKLMENKDQRAYQIYESIGCYLGYTLAYYADFYNMKHVLLMGRVTSGKGGAVIVNKAKEVLADEFPILAKKFTLMLPDEKSRRVGQSVAAASLPSIK